MPLLSGTDTDQSDFLKRSQAKERRRGCTSIPRDGAPTSGECSHFTGRRDRVRETQRFQRVGLMPNDAERFIALWVD